MWDLFGDRMHLGGAPLNFAAHVARLGHLDAYYAKLREEAKTSAQPPFQTTGPYKARRLPLLNYAITRLPNPPRATAR